MIPALRQRNADRVFDRLYRSHAGDVYRYALAITGNQADAEDVTQTTFMNAYRALDRGDRPVKPHHWLITIAHNVCRQRFRQASRRPTEVFLEEDAAEALAPNDEAPTAADIQRALGHLPLNQREALVMRELEGRPNAEIAAFLGLSLSAVEALLFRARRALREQLEGDLTCLQAEAAISRQLDGRLPLADSAVLRGHLRECEECRHLARRQRAQRRGWKALAVAPLPPSLAGWFGGAGAGGAVSVGAGLAVKVAAATVAAAVVGGGGYALVKHETSIGRHPAATAGAAVAAKRAHTPQRATHTSAGAGHQLKHAVKRADHAASVTATSSLTTGAPSAAGGEVVPTQGATRSGARRAHPAHARRPRPRTHVHKAAKRTHRASAPTVTSSIVAPQAPTANTKSCRPTAATAHGKASSDPTSTAPVTDAPCPSAGGGAGKNEHPAHP